MSFSLSNIFGGGNSAPAAATAPAPTPAAAPTTAPTPGNLPTTESTPTLVTPTVDANGTIPASAVGGDSTDPVVTPPSNDPLAGLTGLWDTDPNAAKAEVPAAALDPAELREVIAKGNFAGNVNPEIMQKIEAGGPEAVTATMEAMNAVAQNVMLQATLASNKMIEQSVTAALAKQTSSLPDLIKKHTLSENLVDNNPMLSDPRIAPIAEMLQAQLQLKNPTATSQQLTEMTSKALTAMGQHFTGNTSPTNSPANTPQNEINWDQWATNSPT
jgi:hypothetical protein